MSDYPLFKGMDERERELAPDQLPASSDEAQRVTAEDAPLGNEARHASGERTIPIGGLIGPAGQGEHPGVVGGPGPVIPPVAPAVPVPLPPDTVLDDREREQRAKDE